MTDAVTIGTAVTPVSAPSAVGFIQVRYAPQLRRQDEDERHGREMLADKVELIMHLPPSVYMSMLRSLDARVRSVRQEIYASEPEARGMEFAKRAVVDGYVAFARDKKPARNDYETWEKDLRDHILVQAGEIRGREGLD